MIVGQIQIITGKWIQGKFYFKIIFFILTNNCLGRDDFLLNPLFLSGTSQKPQEPNIDFELDVKVFINSGKCVLHTKDSAKDDDIKL